MRWEKGGARRRKGRVCVSAGLRYLCTRFMLHTMCLKKLLIYLLALLALGSCAGDKAAQTDTRPLTTRSGQPAAYDWEQILDAGELITATLSGPESYYDDSGTPLGTQYALAQAFASENGLHLQVRVGRTARELVQLVNAGEADIVAYLLPADSVRADSLVPAGPRDSVEETAWHVRKATPALARALNAWFTPEKAREIARKEQLREQDLHKVRRVVRPMFLARGKAEFSIYDAFFKKYAGAAGLDWRLVASVCYAESGYDPNAVSNAGARGLMQLMPDVAKELGVTDCYDPEQNIRGGTKVLQRLMQQFATIPNPEERTKFALASYNAGAGHIRDAQALARKYGRDPARWADVSTYVLALQKPEYYRDAVVKNGYMVGRETVAFVGRVASYYRTYGGSLSVAPEAAPQTATPKEGDELKESRYRKDVPIVGPDDPLFTAPTAEKSEGEAAHRTTP